MEGRKKVLGEEHPKALVSLYNFGNLFEAQNKLEEAESLYRMCLVGFVKVFGEEHPNTLEVINTLTMLLKSQGKLEESELLTLPNKNGRL